MLWIGVDEGMSLPWQRASHPGRRRSWWLLSRVQLACCHSMHVPSCSTIQAASPSP